MADKFPEIDAEIPIGQAGDEGDFLAREKTALGEDATQFQTEGDEEYLKADEHDELKKFEEQFPTVQDEEPTQSYYQEESATEEQDDEFDEPVFNAPKGESDAVKEWRERYQLEIATRDENDAKKAQETKEEAVKQLDDFYQSYNDKKDESIKKVRDAEADFLSKRDEFFAKGDTWTRALELVEGLPTNKRFKELLEAKAKSTSF